MRRMLLRNQSGSALVIGLMAVGLIGLITMSAISINKFVGKDATHAKSLSSVDALSQSVALLLSNSDMCMNGTDGPGGQPGMQFDGGVFNSSLAGTAGEQNISIGSHFSNPDGSPMTLAGGSNVMELQLIVDRLYITGVTAIPGQSNSYSAQLMARVSPAGGDVINKRMLTIVNLQTDSSGNLISCSSAQTAQGMCVNMGCNYQADAAEQKCICPMPDMQCPAGQQLTGISGLNSPICSGFSASCSNGTFLTGFDSGGNPLCQAVQKAKQHAGTCFATLCTGGNTWTGPPAPWPPPGFYCFHSTLDMRQDDCFNIIIGSPTGPADFYNSGGSSEGHSYNSSSPWSAGSAVEWEPDPGVSCAEHGTYYPDHTDEHGNSLGDGYWDFTYSCTPGNETGEYQDSMCLGTMAECQNFTDDNTEDCPADSSYVGLGGPVPGGLGGCACDQDGATWDGSQCTGGTVSCPAGFSTGGAGAASDVAPKCFCPSAGQSGSDCHSG